MTAARKKASSTTAKQTKRTTGRRDRVPRKWPASLVLPIPEPDAPPAKTRRRRAA